MDRVRASSNTAANGVRKRCIRLYHRLRGSGSTVVTMTSKVNVYKAILTPYRSETPENIETEIGQIDYVMGPFNTANFGGNRSTLVRLPI